jgi:hypothetical protein
LKEGTWDFQLYYDSGYALGNTYMNDTQWVSDIKITVKYVDGKYDLTVNSSVGKFHYYGDIEGLVIPENTGGEAGDAKELNIASLAVAYNQPGEREILFTSTDGVIVVVDFKGFDNVVPGQPLVARTYSSDDYTIDEAMSIYGYGNADIQSTMSYVKCVVTDNGAGSYTYDCEFTAKGNDYTFKYTSSENNY